jgi:hypothetical protein
MGRLIYAGIALALVLWAVDTSGAAAAQITYSGGPGVTFTSGATTIEFAGGTQVTCTSDVVAGTLAASPANTITNVTIEYMGCKSTGKSCTSTGEASGTIVTTTLHGTVVDLGNGTDVGLYLQPASGTKWFLQVKCGTAGFNTTGTLVSRLTPVGTKTATVSDTYNETEGSQELVRWNGEVTEHFWTGILGVKEERCALASTESLKVSGGEMTVEL